MAESELKTKLIQSQLNDAAINIFNLQIKMQPEIDPWQQLHKALNLHRNAQDFEAKAFKATSKLYLQQQTPDANVMADAMSNLKTAKKLVKVTAKLIKKCKKQNLENNVEGEEVKQALEVKKALEDDDEVFNNLIKRTTKLLELEKDIVSPYVSAPNSPSINIPIPDAMEIDIRTPHVSIPNSPISNSPIPMSDNENTTDDIKLYKHGCDQTKFTKGGFQAILRGIRVNLFY